MAQILLSCVILGLILSLTTEWALSSDMNMSLNNRVMQLRENSDYAKIWNFWEEHKNEFRSNGQHEEVVLVMGNIDVETNILISSLTGRKLDIIESQGYLKVVDNRNQNGPSISSQTLIPRFMTDYDRNLTYINYPGFLNNQDVENEISLLYFQNILMNQVNKIKIILVINYNSLESEENKNNFDNLLDHVSKFIQDDIELYSGIALVVTEVKYSHEELDNRTSILPDDNQLVLNKTINFLENRKKIYRSSTENLEKHQMFANLIDILLQKKYDSYPKITVCRESLHPGLLEDDLNMKNNINAIVMMITENLHYINRQKDDFGFALSESTRITVGQIVDNLFENALLNRLYKMGNDTISKMIKQYSDIKIIRERVTRFYYLISEINNADQLEKLFERFLNVPNILNISVSLPNLNIMSDDIRMLRFFISISNFNDRTSVTLFQNKMQSFINSIESLKNFYDFLDDLEKNLSAYDSQKLKNDFKIRNIMASCSNSTSRVIQDIFNLSNIAETIGSYGMYEKIKTLTLNQFDLKHLEDIFKSFTHELKFLCPSPFESMTVEGYNIKISDVIKSNCWTQAKNIQIFALNKIFIDETINKTGANTELFFFAPTWEVIGKPKIILNGEAGKPHQNMSANSAYSHSKNGTNGLPGLPGGSAGNFFGAGKQFVNLENLEIHANGGNGGPGQHGGNGADGIKGEELPDSFFSINEDEDGVKEYLNSRHFDFTMNRLPDPFAGMESKYSRVYSFHVYVSAKPEIPPTNGGDGGAGGKGGHPGKITIISLGKLVNVTKSINSGLAGLKGQGGQAGKQSMNAHNVKFDYIHGLRLRGVWNTEFKNTEKIVGSRNSFGRNGKSGSNNNNQTDPTLTSNTNLCSAINSFKDFVRMNLFESFKESEIKSFLHEFENNNHIKAQYNVLGFLEQFKGLENNTLEQKTMSNQVSFYNSFRDHVEEYINSENNLVNKKVFNYIHTAVLTKLVALKIKNNPQTVADLLGYLDTVKNGINIVHGSYLLSTVQGYQYDYKNSLNLKIREANYFIQKIIEPEADKLWNKSNNEMLSIINSLNDTKNLINYKQQILETNSEKIHDALLLHATLSPLKLAVTFLKLIVNFEVVSFKEASNLNEDRILLFDPNSELFLSITEVINNKYQHVVIKLNMAIVKLRHYLEQLSSSNNDKLEKKQSIEMLQLQFEKVTLQKSSGFLQLVHNFKDVEKITSTMMTFINSEIDTHEKMQNVENKKQYRNDIRLLNDVKSILNGVEAVFSITSKLVGNKGLVNVINDQIFEYAQQLKNLETMENQVYNIIMPDFYLTADTVSSSVNKFPYAQINISTWNIQSTLKYLKLWLQKFTPKITFELQSHLQRYIEKVEMGFSLLIDIYDCKNFYSDIVKQTESIAHIESAWIEDIQVTDTKLKKVVSDLKQRIHSNILTEKYKMTLQVFVQHNFPIAANISQQLQILPGVRFDNIEAFKSHIIEKIEVMKNYLTGRNVMSKKYRPYIHSNQTFQSNSLDSSPFYVWKHNAFSKEIQQLLRGSEIVVNADVSKGLLYNALKYNDIGINFKLNNKTLQSNFTSVLKNFGLTMKAIGNNYYRCGERYYSISSDNCITVSYILTKNKKQKWLDPNQVYTKIRDNRAFLSPYVMWSIKLEDLNGYSSFDDFDVYINETMDLELIGQGDYIEQNTLFNSEVCNEYLDTVYGIENMIEVLF